MTKTFLAELNPASWHGSFEMGGNRMDPISIGYISSYLRAKGLETRIFQQRQERDEEVLELVRRFAPDYVGLSVMTCAVDHSLKMAREIKKQMPKAKTIFGGYHPTGVSEILADEAVDFVVVGEGERACYDLISAMEMGGDLGGVGSIGFKQGRELTFTPRAKRIAGLDSLPFPDRYKLKECNQGAPMIPTPENQRSFAQVTWSRGCLHNCSFCNSPQMWRRRVYYRSAKNVVDELDYLQDMFGTNGVFFTDLTFNEDRERVMELCGEITRRKMGLNWSCSCRVTDDEEMLGAMRGAGCVRIGFGIESLNNRVLAQIGKGITVEQVKRGIEVANDVGIITRGYYMLGYPHQTREDIADFKSKITDIPLDQIRISFLTPFPGTASYNRLVERDLILDKNFHHYDCDGHYVLRGQLTEADLIRARKDLFQTFYSSPKYRRRIEDKARRFPELRPAYDELRENLAKAL